MHPVNASDDGIDLPKLSYSSELYYAKKNIRHVINIPLIVKILTDQGEAGVVL